MFARASRSSWPRRLLAVLGSLAVLVALAAWILPSGAYLLVPLVAEPADAQVVVPGEKAHDGRGGIYYVAVKERRANWLERIFPALRPEGAELESREEVVPPGSTYAAELERAKAEMARSEEIAAAVALREAGYDVGVRTTGVIVDGVYLDSPSYGTLQRGDVITAAAGRRVLTPSTLRAAVASVKPGEPLLLELERAGKPLELTVKTIHDPRDPARPVIGIAVGQAADITLPLAVKIDLGEVGGPSAGLPLALEVLESLGRDVDRGNRVVATGTIEIDGSVRSVGSIKQKTFGARAANADVFLVPAGDNADEARRYAGNLRVIVVENFQQALRRLATLSPK